MLLDDVATAVSSQLSDQAQLGIQVTDIGDVPDTGPTNGGVWWRIHNVSAVFADLKGSTTLNASGGRQDAAYAYTYFIRAMAVVLERFGAGYVDIHGDGIFGLFSGQGSAFQAAACAVTMRTQTECVIAPQFERDTASDWKLAAGVGMDRGTLLVRRLGLRGTKQNEVWAGKPVNVAAKLSSVAGPNEVVVSDRVYSVFRGAGKLRRRALLWTCGCCNGTTGGGLDIPEGQTSCLWYEEEAPVGMGLDIARVHRLKSKWCVIHGSEFCEVIATGTQRVG